MRITANPAPPGTTSFLDSVITVASNTCQHLYIGMEEILFKSESSQSREDIAAYLRSIADKLDADGEVTLSAGEQSQTLSVPARPVFEVKVEREQSKSGPAELSIELELEWDEGADETGSSLDVS